MFQDGTQIFGVAAVTIATVSYVAEDLTITMPVQVVEIKDGNGTPIGQSHVPGNPNGTMKLQLATSSTAIPSAGAGATFTFNTVVYYLTQVGQKYSQGAYAYVDVSFAKKIN